MGCVDKFLAAGVWVHACVYVHVHVHVCVCVCVCVYVCTCTCTCVYNIYIYIYTYLSLYIYIYREREIIYIYIYIYTCIVRIPQPRCRRPSQIRGAKLQRYDVDNTRKCRYNIVVWSWAGVRRSRVQFQPPLTIRVRRQTLQSLWGSAFASGANHRATGSITRGLAGSSTSKNN